MCFLSFVWRQLEFAFFGAPTSVGALFICCRSKYGQRYAIPKKTIDVTGVELTPGEPDVCLGNGAHGFECCCDECDYMLCCLETHDYSQCSTCNDKNCPLSSKQEKHSKRCP